MIPVPEGTNRSGLMRARPAPGTPPFRALPTEGAENDPRLVLEERVLPLGRELDVDPDTNVDVVSD